MVFSSVRVDFVSRDGVCALLRRIQKSCVSTVRSHVDVYQTSWLSVCGHIGCVLVVISKSWPCGNHCLRVLFDIVDVVGKMLF